MFILPHIFVYVIIYANMETFFKKSLNFTYSVIRYVTILYYIIRLRFWKRKSNSKDQNVIAFKNAEAEICHEQSQGNTSIECIFVSFFLIACYIIFRGQVIFPNDSNHIRVKSD